MPVQLLLLKLYSLLMHRFQHHSHLAHSLLYGQKFMTLLDKYWQTDLASTFFRCFIKICDLILRMTHTWIQNFCPIVRSLNSIRTIRGVLHIWFSIFSPFVNSCTRVVKVAVNRWVLAMFKPFFVLAFDLSVLFQRNFRGAPCLHLRQLFSWH